MAPDIRSFFRTLPARATKASAPSPASRTQTTAENNGDADSIMVTTPGKAPPQAKKRLQTQALSEQPAKKIRRVFSHVAVPVRPRDGPYLTVENCPVTDLPTPSESSIEKSVSSRRRKSEPVSYVESLLTPSSDDGSDSGTEVEEAGSGDGSEYEGTSRSGSAQVDDEDEEESSSAIEEEFGPDDSEAHDVDAVSEDDVMEIDMHAASSTKSAKKPTRKSGGPRAAGPSSSRGIDVSLPPRSNIYDIFFDITRNALSHGFDKTLEALDGQELRVATMCSGTESPLLALQLVSQILEQRGEKPLRLKHMFSAEIVPKKQAYIERNFKPPIIFRDIRELAEDEAVENGATNVYGAKVPIPGDVDLLVAGFSCVDFSNLNTKKKTINMKGESRDTLSAILSYANRWRPRMIVLENVHGAPWDDCQKRAEDVGYAARWIRVDTKDYYLPQTRNRGYMFCLDEQQCHGDADVEQAVERWTELMKLFKQRASAPATAFLLPTDDSRVFQFNAELTRHYRENANDRSVTWDACHMRHEKVRVDEDLGNEKPITEWVKDGTCVAFEHAHKQWLSKQVERVWDSIDIRCLRAAKENNRMGPRGFDALFKTMLMELSQNVDRSNETAFGICGCITPGGIFYLTDRGGPLTPYETLALQGIPLDKISFTIETINELQDLAGNAMSSTVVGAAQLAALMVAIPILKRPGSRSPTATVTPALNATLCGEEHLRQMNQDDMAHLSTLDASLLCADAQASVRRCRCEGQLDITEKRILMCDECQHTVCTNCASKPTHAYGANEVERSLNLTPRDFELRWKPAFPTSFKLKEAPDFSHLREHLGVDGAVWVVYMDALSKLPQEHLTFQSFKRAAHWTVRYESPKATLELMIAKRAEWRLYVKPPNDLPGNDPARKFLENPVARALLPEDFLSHNQGDRWATDWKWFIPSHETFKVYIEGSNETRPSWRADYGLVYYEKEQIPQRLVVRISARDGLLEEDVSGTYYHLLNCGTACSSLYRRIQSDNSAMLDTDTTTPETDPLFLFLDPSRIGSVNEDAFVFSRSHERLEYDETREVVTSLSPEFRPWDRSSFQTHGSVAGRWLSAKTELHAVKTDLIVSNPTANSNWDESTYVNDCSDYLAVLSVRFHAQDNGGQSTVYRPGDGNSKSSFFTKFSWILEKSRHIPTLKDWRPVQLHSTAESCSRCYPQLPQTRWRQLQDKRGKSTKVLLIPHEDPGKAAEFERGLKTRPSILDIKASIDQLDICHIQVGINIVSLAHRARALLGSCTVPVSLSWNLTTEYTPHATPQLPPFRLLNNLGDAQHPQLEGFKLDLKLPQRRSLTWMRRQEKGAPFSLEEIEEEVVDSLRWKIEARAKADVEIKGGVIADQVSFGKTVTTLALIHAGFLDNEKLPEDDTLIPLKATLVVVPNSVTIQWRNEVKKYLGDKDYGDDEVILIKSVDDLRKKQIRQFQKAKIVIVPFHVLEKEPYWRQFEKVTAMPEAPTTEGRAFSAWFEYALSRLPQMTKKLQEVGLRAFEQYREAEFEKTLEHPDFQGVIPTKRLKGAHYKSFEELSNPKGKKKGVGKNPQKGKGKEEAPSGPAPSGPAPIRGDWEQYKFPLLHQFRFNRLVIDEFTYPKNKEYAALIALRADKRWILSGTPPLDDFADVKRIASFLGVNLGIDCDAPGVITRQNAKAIQKEQTKFEEFQSFRQKRSATWHERRHQHAQDFLDAFARQNFADIGDVTCFEHLKPVELRPDHRAIYMELLAYLNAQNMRIRQPANTDKGHRIQLVKAALKGQSIAEEALLACASHHFVDSSTDSACATLIYQRQADMDDKKVEIEQYVRKAEALQRGSGHGDSQYERWKAKYLETDNPTIKDRKAHHDLKKIIAKAVEETQRSSVKSQGSSEVAAAELKRLLRDKLSTEERKFVDFRRSLRYVRHVKKIHQACTIPSSTVACECGDCNPQHEVLASNTAILIGCGHIACEDCLEDILAKKKCQVEGCDIEVGEHHVVKATDLPRCDDLVPDQESYGAKLDEVLSLLQDRKRIADDEQVIVFVQSYSMMSCVRDALKSRAIAHYAIDRKSDTASGEIQDWIKNQRYLGSKKENKNFRQVLVLNLGDESASGMNLVNANHVIFVSPLLTDTGQKYQAAMVQAIGRARRYGQTKPVHVYRFVALKTVDVDILEQRELRREALWEGVHAMARPFEPGATDFESTRLIKDADGKMVLAPQSWLSDLDEVARHGIDLGAVDDARAIARFNSLTRFSDTYAQDGGF